MMLLIACQPQVKQQYANAGIKYTLDNGLVVITKENKNTDLVVFDLFVKTGTITETKNGISYLTTKSILTGTDKYSREELTGMLEKVGGNFEVKPTVQYDEITIRVPSTATSEALKFLEQILKYPSFDEDEIEKEKTFIKNEIKQKEDNPQATSDELLFKELFIETPYAMPVEGTEESLDRISAEEVEQYYKDYFVPNNMVLVIAGNINDKMITSIQQTLGKLKYKETKIPEIRFRTYEPKTIEQNEYTDSYYVNIGYRTVPAIHPDTPKLKALHGLLGQGPASRLFFELREKKGLAYRLETLNPTIKDTGVFKISMITSPDKLNETIKLALEQVNRVKQEKISEEELKEVKARIKGYYALFHQLSSDVTEYLGLYEVTGRGYEWDEYFLKSIETITAEEIQEIANKYLNDPVITIVGPFKEVEIKSFEEIN